jgi:predicted ATPase
MKLISLQLSNIISFQFVPDIGQAEAITFDDDLNIIIGENGSGKSTALEAINFLFRRVLYRQYNLNQDLYAKKDDIGVDERKQTIQPVNSESYAGFRLEPNWSTEDKAQTIRIKVRLDDIDKKNIAHLLEKQGQLWSWATRYTTRSKFNASVFVDTYTLDVVMNAADKTFRVTPHDSPQDFGYEYLTEYNYYKESIALYNLEYPAAPIDTLYESFVLISSFRNYNTFSPSISLKDKHPTTQIQQIRDADFKRSLNAIEKAEPGIFALVRLRVAERHFGLISKKMDEAECEAAANDTEFIKEINARLTVIGLQCKIKLLDLRTWQYRFDFFDLKRQRNLADINSLSAGQKSIIHLIFEAYGRGDTKGGLVIIDEPEIHLHYQFQHEYLEVVRRLNEIQRCQYILVTHSEALINSSTIGSVRRFALNAEGFTEIRFPRLTMKQKLLIRVLDNTRSTYAFFAKKVVLVEGSSDRYFFKAVLQQMHREKDQEIAILQVASKNELAQWTELFESFGLNVYRIADLDYAYNMFYQGETQTKLNTVAAVAGFMNKHPDCVDNIASGYSSQTYILQYGDLEHYLGIRKDLAEVITFCREALPSFLANDSDKGSLEIRKIFNEIAR